MRGRKLEEDDWAASYCAAKHIPHRGWSNLNIDVMHDGLGIEHKMLSWPEPISEAFGRRLMHPSATCSIRLPDTKDANEAMTAVLTQYADLIRLRTQKVAETAAGRTPDMRTGWLLWRLTLEEFLYFEEEMLPPDPADFRASWTERVTTGARKRQAGISGSTKETPARSVSR